MRTTSRGGSRTAAFTLVELLAGLAIVAVLAALAASGLDAARKAAARMEGTHVLRGIGQAIFLYSVDHQNRVPGPLYWRQSARYAGSDGGNLIPALATYMGGGAELTGLPFPPAYARAWTATLAAAPATSIYTVNTAAVSGYGQMIWGDANIDRHGQLPGSQPLPMSVVRDPAGTWAVQDILYKNMVGSTNSSATTIFGKYQNNLFFDGHVEITRL